MLNLLVQYIELFFDARGFYYAIELLKCFFGFSLVRDVIAVNRRNQRLKRRKRELFKQKFPELFEQSGVCSCFLNF